MANILLGCEESQAVMKEFRKLGHEAFSCDTRECTGDFPEYHLRMDIFEAIKLKKWDMMIAFPPCTYLTVSGNRWFYHPDDKDLPYEERRPHPKHPNRRKQREEAIQFFLDLANADIQKIAIENPVGIMSTVWRKPDQYIHPYHFGDPFSKKTGLWLKNLPKLKPTNIVDPGEYITYESGKRLPKWFAELYKLSPSERSVERSKTFKGIAEAMAKQWSEVL